MIVQRATFRVKKGRLDEAVAMVVAETKKYPSVGSRVYRTYIAPLDTLSIEWEFENLAELDSYWVDWYAKPETDAYVEKWNALTETGGTNEVWRLAE